MLRIEKLNQYYGGSHILRDLSFEIPAGKVTALLGRNGVGKTTLLRVLMGLVPTRTGEVKFFDKDITHAKPYERAQAGIGYVPQGREIFPRLTVEENLRMGFATLPRGARVPERIYEMFPVLRQMLGRRGGDLSGGQQQQLAIARALASDPKVLLLDEVAGGLTEHECAALVALIKDIRQAGISIIWIEHIVHALLAVVDRLAVLHGGAILAQGAPQAVIRAPAVAEIYMGIEADA